MGGSPAWGPGAMQNATFHSVLAWTPAGGMMASERQLHGHVSTLDLTTRDLSGVRVRLNFRPRDAWHAECECRVRLNFRHRDAWRAERGMSIASKLSSTRCAMCCPRRCVAHRVRMPCATKLSSSRCAACQVRPKFRPRGVRYAERECRTRPNFRPRDARGAERE